MCLTEYTCEHIHICLYIAIYYDVFTCTYIYIYKDICTHIFTYIYIDIYNAYLCIYIYIYIYMNLIYMCVGVYIYIYVHNCVVENIENLRTTQENRHSTSQQECSRTDNALSKASPMHALIVQDCVHCLCLLCN